MEKRQILKARCRRTGRPLGKRAAGLKVADESENPINFGQSLIRSLPQLIPALFFVSFSTARPSSRAPTDYRAIVILGLTGLVFVVETAGRLFSEKHRALRDMIAGTVVRRTDV